MYIKTAISPAIKFYPSIYYNLTKGFIPDFSELFNSQLEKFRSQDTKYFNFKHDYVPNYNKKILTTVQFNYNLKEPNGYTSICEIRDKLTNTYIYEYIRINLDENKFHILNEFQLNYLNKNNTRLTVNTNADIESIMSTISNINFGMMTYSGNKSSEKLIYKMLTNPETNLNNNIQYFGQVNQQPII